MNYAETILRESTRMVHDELRYGRGADRLDRVAIVIRAARASLENCSGLEVPADLVCDLLAALEAAGRTPAGAP